MSYLPREVQRILSQQGVSYGSGPEDFYLISSQLHVDDRLVSPNTVQVDPERSHKIGLKHTVGNRDPRSAGDPFGWWRTCTAVYNETDRRAVKADTCEASGGSGGGTSHIDVGRITKPTRFRIKLWANQAHTAGPLPQGYW